MGEEGPRGLLEIIESFGGTGEDVARLAKSLRGEAVDLGDLAKLNSLVGGLQANIARAAAIVAERDGISAENLRENYDFLDLEEEE